MWQAEVGDGDYRIGIGDTIDVQVVRRPEISRDALVVDSRGRIRLPYIEEPILAACATVDELATFLEERYARYLREPQVTVTVRQYSTQSVEVLGAVAKPGLFQLQRVVRLRELLSIAGGLAPEAAGVARFVHGESDPVCRAGDPNQSIFRHETTVTSVDIAELMRGQGANPVVRPGDLIHVPEADRVFVVGQVVKPTALPLTGRLTVSRAVAMAGGRTSNAKNEARIVRMNVDGRANTDLVVDLKAIDRDGAPDLELQAGDVVEVPTASGRQALKFVLSSVLTAGLYYPLLIIR